MSERPISPSTILPLLKKAQREKYTQHAPFPLPPTKQPLTKVATGRQRKMLYSRKTNTYQPPRMHISRTQSTDTDTDKTPAVSHTKTKLPPSPIQSNAIGWMKEKKRKEAPIQLSRTVHETHQRASTSISTHPSSFRHSSLTMGNYYKLAE